MKHYLTTVANDKYQKKYAFECYENTEPIEVGDYYLFWFGCWTVGHCESEHEKIEININNIEKKPNCIDFVSGFWKNCFKIKSTDFDYKLLN